jgi:AraC-like DNA-binding protein
MRDKNRGPGEPVIELDYALPAHALARFVSGYHRYRLDLPDGGVLDDVFYPGAANIRIQVSGGDWSVRIGERRIDPVPRASLFGPTSHAIYSRSAGGTLFGAGITPLGWTRLTTLPASDFADTVVPLEALLGEDAARLAGAIGAAQTLAEAAATFDAFFAARFAPASPEDDRIEAMHALLAAGETIGIAEAAATLDLHPRTFARLAHRAFGFAPKRLLRRARFLRSLMVLREPSGAKWSDRIGEGYYDQSHFIRDAHEFLGMAPREFLRLKKPMNDASTQRRGEVLGAPAQALHRPGVR